MTEGSQEDYVVEKESGPFGLAQETMDHLMALHQIMPENGATPSQLVEADALCGGDLTEEVIQSLNDLGLLWRNNKGELFLPSIVRDKINLLIWEDIPYQPGTPIAPNRIGLGTVFYLHTRSEDITHRGLWVVNQISPTVSGGIGTINASPIIYEFDLTDFIVNPLGGGTIDLERIVGIGEISVETVIALFRDAFRVQLQSELSAVMIDELRDEAERGFFQLPNSY